MLRRSWADRGVVMCSAGEVLKRHAAGYIQLFGQRMAGVQKKVLRAVEACREPSLGTVGYRCVSCGHSHRVPRSCCNRHCPACQYQRQQQWLKKQTDLLLPCQYFLITFTLPGPLRPVAMGHPGKVYRALMQAASDAIKQGAKIPRFVGAQETGFLGVLHTWGRDLSYHPHAHFLVPAGGIDAQGRWVSSRADVLVAEQVLETIFRRRLKHLLGNAGLQHLIPQAVWRGRIVVDSKAVGSGGHALKYLAPYVSRGPVANWRVTQCDDASDVRQAQLTLMVKRSGTRQYRPMKLTASDFIARWLRHVLPTGLHRVRHYGFFSSSSRRRPEELKLLVAAALGRLHYLACTELIVMATPAAMMCPVCGGSMVSLGYRPPSLARFTTWSLGDTTSLPTRAPP